MTSPVDSTAFTYPAVFFNSVSIMIFGQNARIFLYEEGPEGVKLLRASLVCSLQDMLAMKEGIAGLEEKLKMELTTSGSPRPN